MSDCHGAMPTHDANIIGEDSRAVSVNTGARGDRNTTGGNVTFRDVGSWAVKW